MKATVVFLTCVGALALASVVPQQPERKVADKEFLEKQHNILKLFFDVHQPEHDQEEHQAGNNFDPRTQIDKFSNSYAVKEFINAYKKGMLPRGEIFSIHYYNHLEEAIKLFDIMYFAKDYNTFYQVACWAKARLNEGQYVYALAVAVLHRPDCQGIQLPPLTELAPFYYVDNHAVHHAIHLKQLGHTSATILANYTGQYPNWEYENEHEHPWHQQQDQQSQPQEHKYPFHHHNAQHMKEYQQQYNQESKLSYYTEDVGLNQLYAQIHLLQPFWFNTKKYQGNKYQNEGYGENVYYMYQQALARYNQERLAHELPPVTPIIFNQPLQPGYSPNVQYGNGQHFPARPENMVLSQQGNQYFLLKVQDFERRLRDAIDAEYVYATDGSKVPLTAENGVEILGKLMCSNADAVNNDYYGFQYGYYGYVQMLKKVVSNIVDPYYQYGAAPGCIENYNTALRDPAMYQIIARVVSMFQAFKNKIQPYKQDQIYYQGVKIDSVDCGKMTTYFDSYNIDLHNTLAFKQDEDEEKYEFKASQLRLNNKPFTYKINVHSDKNEDAIVRVFLGPKYNAQGQTMSLQQAKNYFVEIDRFVTPLKSGQNAIERNSKQSNAFSEDHEDSHTIFRKVKQAQQGGEPFYYTEDHSHRLGFPERLMLPLGSRSGHDMILFVIINKYEPSANQNPHGYNYYHAHDNHAEGYPLDRQINESVMSNCPNCYYKEVTVYYKPHSEINIAA